MADITYVGGVAGSRAGSTSTTSQSLTSLTGGSDSAPQEGDLVVVTVGVGSQGRNPSCAISGWSTVGTQLSITVDTYDTSLQVSYKFMTSSPDTSVTIPSSGNIADGQAWAIHVFRGVDPTTPLDVAVVTATGNNTARFDAGPITPTTAGAWVLICGAGAASSNTTAYTAPSGYTTNWRQANGADTNDCQVGAGYYTGWTSGEHNPGVVGGGSTNTANSWAAFTLALRPAITIYEEDPADSGALTDSVTEGHYRGTIYHVVYPSALGEPSTTQIKAGQNASGGAAVATDNDPAPASSGEYVFSAATGLSSGTSYKASFVWSNGTNDSNVVTTTAWQTTAVYDDDVADSGALTDAAAAMMLLVGSASDSGVLTDTASGQRVSGDAISDSGALTDTAAGGLVLAGSVSDSGALTDAVTGVVSVAEVVSDSVAGSDAAASTWVVGESVTDAADITDQVTGVGIWLEAASDSAAVTDAAMDTLASVDSLADSVATTDTATAALVVAEVLSDSAEATDSAAGQAIYAEAVSDSADLSDTATGDSGFDASVVDSAEASESVSTSLIASDALADAAESLDGVVVTAVYQEIVSDTLSATESVVESVGGHSYFESVEDALEASDSTLATLLSFGASVRSQGGGSGGGRLWTRDLDDEIEAEMGAILKGPPLTSEVIEEITARLDSPPQTRIMEHRRPTKAAYSPPILDFQAIQARKRRNRQRLLLLL